MSQNRVRTRSALCAAVAVTAAVTTFVLAPSSASAAIWNLPPAATGFDYQIGGVYTPPADAQVISRDHSASPAADKYNICYVNAFQTQKPGTPGGPEEWDPDLLLQVDGEVIIDEVWNEAILDISTDEKRQTIANLIKIQIDECASKHFDALELDNYDSYTRDGAIGALTADDAQAYIRILSSYGHSKGLAVAQKNTLELAPNRVANGLDFAIAEECGQQEIPECGSYIASFGSQVIMIEYTDTGMTNACEFKGQASIVQRDVNVTPAGTGTYVRKLCP